MSKSPFSLLPLAILLAFCEWIMLKRQLATYPAS
jgi:hypothetical protein